MNLHCMRFFAFILFVSLLCPLPLQAQEGGPSGLVQYTFQKTDAKSIYEESDLDAFTQRYDLGYQGYGYDPRLFQYDIGGSFIRQDSELDQSTAGNSSVTAENTNYHAKLDFLQGTRVPFTFHTEKFDVPTWTVQPDQSYLTRQTVDQYGLYGNVGLGAATNLRYDVHQDETRTEGPLQDTDQLNKSASVGVDSRHGDTYFNANYGYQHDLEKVAGRNENINDARVAFGLKPSADMRFNMDASYHDDSYYEFSDAGTSMNLYYAPSSGFNNNLRVYGDRITQHEQTGTFTTLMNYAFYRINPLLTSTADFTLSNNQGAFANDTTESLTLGLAFVRPLPNNVTVSAAASANGTLQQFETAPVRNSTAYTVTTNIAKNFPAINTQINGGGSAYTYSSSLGGRDTRYGYNAALVSRVARNLTFQSLLNFTRENSVRDAVDLLSLVTPTTEPGSATVPEHLVSDNSLEYSLTLGGRGTFDAKTGALFDRGTAPRTLYYGAATLLYAPKSNLALNGGLNYIKDTMLQTGTLSASLGANYHYRSLTMTLKNDWWREQTPQGVRRLSNVIAQVSRPF